MNVTTAPGTHPLPAEAELSSVSGVDDALHLPGWRWAAVAVAFPLAGLLGRAVGGPVDAVAAALVGGALTGAGLGAVQWWAARRALGRATTWIGASAAGYAAGLAAQRGGARRRAGARAGPGGTPRARGALGDGDAGTLRAGMVRDVAQRYQRGRSIHRVRSRRRGGLHAAQRTPPRTLDPPPHATGLMADASR